MSGFVVAKKFCLLKCCSFFLSKYDDLALQEFFSSTSTCMIFLNQNFLPTSLSHILTVALFLSVAGSRSATREECDLAVHQAHREEQLLQ